MMSRVSLAALLLVLGSSVTPAQARDLEVEVAVLHIGGLLSPAQLQSLLADERLSIEAVYEPTRLIEGVTARRERTMPLGSKLYPIPQVSSLKGAQVERRGPSLRFKLADTHPEHANYRLLSLNLRTPIAPGPGRPQPDLSVDLLNPVPRSGAQENALYSRFGAFDLGLRVRHRWSDAQGAVQAGTAMCSPDIQSPGDGQYYFRQQHRMAGLFRFLASDVQSDPPARPREGRRSLQLRAPFPEPLAGLKLSRNHLLQLQIDGQSVERLSLYGEQAGAGRCSRTRSYEALFAGGQLVEAKLSTYETGCAGEDSSRGRSVEAAWLEGEKLASYQVTSPEGSQSWQIFPAAMVARCGMKTPPPAGEEVRALKTELQLIREAFLR